MPTYNSFVIQVWRVSASFPEFFLTFPGYLFCKMSSPDTIEISEFKKGRSFILNKVVFCLQGAFKCMFDILHDPVVIETYCKDFENDAKK